MCLQRCCVAVAAARTTEKAVPLLLYHCCFRVCRYGNVFTQPLPKNGPGISAISQSLHSNCFTRYNSFLSMLKILKIIKILQMFFVIFFQTL
jgi:hypothetical protein